MVTNSELQLLSTVVIYGTKGWLELLMAVRVMALLVVQLLEAL
ncbi:hypothetical protein [Nostoc sp. JL33]|nr:hypothetical protein [Nostoc sp. JL33]